jgi:hypothetical protein
VSSIMEPSFIERGEPSRSSIVGNADVDMEVCDNLQNLSLEKTKKIRVPSVR